MSQWHSFRSRCEQLLIVDDDCCVRLTHDVTLDSISTAEDVGPSSVVAYDCNKQSDARQQRQATSSTLSSKLHQSRIETRNQLNAAKSKQLMTGIEAQSEKTDAQSETPPDKKHMVDSRLVPPGLVCRSPRIEDVADTGLNALSNCGGSSRRRQTTDPGVICRNVTSSNSVTSRLDEIRQRFKPDVRVASPHHSHHLHSLPRPCTPDLKHLFHKSFPP